MPRFTQEVTVDTDIDISISVQDFYDELDHYDIQELIEILIENEDINKEDDNSESDSIYEWEFNKMVKKITDNRVMLTKEEEELLKKISDRF